MSVDLLWQQELQEITNTERRHKRIYVAGALSSLPPEELDTRTPSKVVVDYIINIQDMCQIAGVLRKMGYYPFVPALDFLLGAIYGRFEEEDYRGIGIAFLEVCDAVLAVSDSTGVQREIARAEELGIPVYWRLEELEGA